MSLDALDVATWQWQISAANSGTTPWANHQGDTAEYHCSGIVKCTNGTGYTGTCAVIFQSLDELGVASFEQY